MCGQELKFKSLNLLENVTSVKIKNCRSENTFDKVSLDMVGKLPTTPDGNNYILTIQDSLFKYCIVVSIPDILAITIIAHAIAKHLFSQYGAPKDRGGSLINILSGK